MTTTTIEFTDDELTLAAGSLIMAAGMTRTEATKKEATDLAHRLIVRGAMAQAAERTDANG